MRDELIERLARAYESGERAVRGGVGELASEAGIRAVLAELAKTDVGEVMPTARSVLAAFWNNELINVNGNGIERKNQFPDQYGQRVVDLFITRTMPIIAALRARVAELEAHIASRMPYPDIHIAASPEAIDEVLADLDAQADIAAKARALDEPIADPAKRVQAVAKILREEMGIIAKGVGLWTIALPQPHMAYHNDEMPSGTGRCFTIWDSAHGNMGPRAIADEIRKEEARRAKEWAEK